jgi:hypothetical protein
MLIIQEQFKIALQRHSSDFLGWNPKHNGSSTKDFEDDVINEILNKEPGPFLQPNIR